MLKKIIYSLAFSVMLLNTTHAQTPTTQSIEELLVITNSENDFNARIAGNKTSTDEMVRDVLNVQKNVLNEKELKQMQEFFNAVNSKIDKTYKWENIKTEMIKVYAEVYTQDEINSMIDYYKSPLGKSILSKSGLYAQKNNEAMSKYDNQIKQALLNEIEKIAQ
jgi:uncharacterized protein